MNTWLGGLDAADAATGMRTCFRIQEPLSAGGQGNGQPGDQEQEAGRSTDTRDVRWTLALQMQSREDPSLVVPASKIWDSDAGTADFLGGRFGNVQESFLKNLGRASKLSPEIEKLLESPRPSFALMTTEEAYTFLKERAPPLDIRMVQIHLGHASLKSTQRYAHVTQVEVASEVRDRLNFSFRLEEEVDQIGGRAHEHGGRGGIRTIWCGFSPLNAFTRTRKGLFFVICG